DADVVDGSGEVVGGERRADEGGVAAVGAPVDGNAGSVNDALLDGPLAEVDEVIVHGSRQFTDGCGDVLPAVAGRTPEVGLEHGVAAVGQELQLAVVDAESPGVVGPWPPVRHQDQGQV